MKNFTKFLAIVVLGLGFSAATFAQATATATATILVPISIAKTGTDLNFGNIIAGGGGTVTVAPDGTRSAVGPTLPVANAGTISAAQFTVTGDGTATFAITLPPNHTITRVSGSETMTVNAFSSNPSGTGALVGGTASLNVGATLTVGAAQVPGVYTNAAGFVVTVNYN